MRHQLVLGGLLLALAATADVASGCTPSGKSARDKQIAAEVCQSVADYPDQIISVWVTSTVMGMNVTKPYYRSLLADRLTAKEMVRSMLKVMQAKTQSPVVSFRLYWDNSVVIKGDVTMMGEYKVVFVDD